METSINKDITLKEGQFKSSGLSYLSICPEDGDSGGFKFQDNNKYIEFTPVSMGFGVGGKDFLIKPSKGECVYGGTGFDGKNRLAKDTGVSYKDILGVGLNINILPLKTLWRKTISIKTIDCLGVIPENAKFLEVVFSIGTNFDISEGHTVLESDIRIGERTCIRKTKVWDSTGNMEFIQGVIDRDGDEITLTKYIPVKFLEKAVYPVYSDVDLSYGTALEHSTNLNTQTNAIAAIDTDKFVVFFGSSAADTECRVGTVSGTTITYGTQVEVWGATHEGDNGLGVCSIGTNKFLLAYTGSGADGFVRVGTVSTREITLGLAVEHESGNTLYSKCAKLDTDKFVIAYVDNGNSNYGKVTIGTVSGTTIDSRTNAQTFATSTIKYTNVCQLDTDKFVVCYMDDVDSDKLKARAATVSSNTASFGTVAEILGSSTLSYANPVCTQLDTDKFVVCYTDSNLKLYAKIGTVSGTNITFHSATELATGIGIGFANLSVCKVDSSRFLIACKNFSDSQQGSSMLCSFSETTVTAGSFEDFYSGTIYENARQSVDVCLISTDKVAIAYGDDDNYDDGYTVIGDVSSAISGPLGVKTINDLAIASVKTINDTAIASVKTLMEAS